MFKNYFFNQRHDTFSCWGASPSSCPAQASSPPASPAIYACICAPGMFDVGTGECAACATGTYKEQAVDDEGDVAAEAAPCGGDEAPRGAEGRRFAAEAAPYSRACTAGPLCGQRRVSISMGRIVGPV